MCGRRRTPWPAGSPMTTWVCLPAAVPCQRLAQQYLDGVRGGRHRGVDGPLLDHALLERDPPVRHHPFQLAGRDRQFPVDPAAHAAGPRPQGPAVLDGARPALCARVRGPLRRQGFHRLRAQRLLPGGLHPAGRSRRRPSVAASRARASTCASSTTTTSNCPPARPERSRCAATKPGARPRATTRCPRRRCRRGATSCSTRATGATWTRTAICTSSTARRTPYGGAARIFPRRKSRPSSCRIPKSSMPRSTPYAAICRG